MFKVVGSKIGGRSTPSTMATAIGFSDCSLCTEMNESSPLESGIKTASSKSSSSGRSEPASDEDEDVLNFLKRIRLGKYLMVK